jgi:hypothetical protein
MSQIPPVFQQINELTEEQQQTVKTWSEDNPGCTLHQLMDFVNSL